MPMIIPSIVTLTLPPEVKQLMAFLMLRRRMEAWRAEADNISARFPDWERSDRSGQKVRLLERIRSLILEAESDDTPNRLDQLCNSVDEVLKAVPQEFSSLREDTTEDWASIISSFNTVPNPFRPYRTLRRIESLITVELRGAEERREQARLEADAARNRYLSERTRAQDIENNRVANQVGQDIASTTSLRSAAWLIISILIGIVTGVTLIRFTGGTWSGLLAGLVFALSILIFSSKRRGDELASTHAVGSAGIFPDEFKNALRAYATKFIDQYVAVCEAQAWEERQRGLSSLAVEQGLNGLENRLEEVIIRLEREIESAPQGFFSEVLPGDAKLHGLALANLLIRNAEERSGSEQLSGAIAAALASNMGSQWHARLAGATTDSIVEDMSRAAALVIGDLKFSAVLAQVLNESQGAAAAKVWLDRLRMEVLAAARLRDGIARDSGIRETLSCGLPGGKTDLLASEMHQRFGCEIHEGTISDGLELVCITRNVHPTDLASTTRLKESFERLDPTIRDILFKFPSREEGSIKSDAGASIRERRGT